MKTCDVVYQGKTYPRFRGVKCQMPEGHSCRHRNATDALLSGLPLSWWTEEEKVEIRARRGAA